jgi:predicted NBD/HSP70 family sugar kinase
MPVDRIGCEWKEGSLCRRGSKNSIRPAPKGHETIIQSILESAYCALEQADVAISELTAIRVGASGISNPETGILFTSPHLPGCRDIPLRDIMQERLGKLKEEPRLW